MLSNTELYEQLKDNTISDKNLIIGLQNENFRIVAMCISRIIERDLYDDSILQRLEKLSQLLKDNKFVGSWQFGHFALSALSLLRDKRYKNRFNILFSELDDNDKFLVENFIKAEAYKI